jgi:hypothetical protein
LIFFSFSRSLMSLSGIKPPTPPPAALRRRCR